MSWYEAQSHCRKSYTDLVSIRDQSQNEAVKTSAMTRNTSFWIGLLRDDWEWTDGGRSAYRNWATGQPEVNLNCTAMTTSIDHDGKCATRHHHLTTRRTANKAMKRDRGKTTSLHLCSVDLLCIVRPVRVV
ncbi:hypothetical protein AOLI_G00220950 [Acnodon oligacanthus]